MNNRENSGYSAAVKTKVNFVKMEVAADGTGSSVTNYCFKYNYTASTSPSATDNCWQPFAASDQKVTVDISEVPYRVPFTPGIYAVAAWVMDAAGNISNMSSKTVSVDYNPILPPSFSHLYATYKIDESDPSPSNTQSLSNNRIVYIRWVVSTTNPKGLLPMKILYTTDDTKPYVDMGVSLDPNNTTPSNCKLSAAAPASANGVKGYAGCYQYTLPASVDVSKYVRFRVQAEDFDHSIAFGQTNALDLPKFTFLAGNTEAGLGSTATAAILTPRGTQPLVVHSSGRIFVLDNRGLLVVDPLDGTLKPFIAGLSNPLKIALDNKDNLLVFDGDRIRKVDMSGASPTMTTIIGGGPRSDDVLANPLDLKITVPSAPQFLFFAASNGDIYFQAEGYATTPANGAQIRRYVASTKSIETIKISGNAPVFPEMRALGLGPVANPPVEQCVLHEVAFTFNADGSPKSMLPLFKPSGATATDSPCWVSNQNAPYYTYFDYATFKYDTAASKVVFSNMPAVPRLATFSKTFGIREGDYVRYFQSLSNKLYAVVNGVGANNDFLYSYDNSLNTWSVIAGQANGGECANNTPATDCALNLGGVFVDAQDKVYLLDNNTVRVIQDNGNILTIAGESKSAGDGKNPLSARFYQIGAFDYYPKNAANPTFIMSDYMTIRLRDFKENGVINTIAGTGVDYADADANIWKTQDAKTLGMSFGRDAQNASFVATDSGDVIMAKFQGQQPYKISHASGKWETLSKTNGSVGGYGAAMVGLHDDKLLFATFNWLSSVLGGGNGRLYEQNATYADGNLPVTVMSKPNAANTASYPYSFGSTGANELCASGSSRLDCNGTYTGTGRMPMGTYDKESSSWVVGTNATTNQGRIVSFPVSSDASHDAVTDLLKFPTLNLRSFALAGSVAGGDKRIYTCMSDGKIYKYLNGSATPTVLSFPVAGMKCAQYSGTMLYSTERRKSEGGTLIFAYEINGLQGIAEFVNP